MSDERIEELKDAIAEAIHSLQQFEGFEPDNDPELEEARKKCSQSETPNQERRHV